MTSNFEIGMTLWMYTARNGKFSVHEGVVTENKRRYWTRSIVTFKTRSTFDFLPKDDEIGHIVSGPKLWLTERDDALAKRLFLEYEEEKLEGLKRTMAKKEELIRVLREG